MDVDRNLRFSIPAFVFLLSLLFCMTTSPKTWELIRPFLEGTKEKTVGAVLLAIVSGGTIVLAGGFLISAIGYILLRLFLFVFHRIRGICEDKGNRFHWCADYVSREDLKTLYERFYSLPDNFNYYEHGYCMFSWLTHGSDCVTDTLREWFSRRWNTFLVHIHSIVALGMALIIGACFFPGARVNMKWILGTFVVVVFLLINACYVRQESTRMWRFLASQTPEKKRESPETNQETLSIELELDLE